MDKYYEIPKFIASIFFYDEEPSPNIPNQLREILESCGYFPPSFIFAGKLTRGRCLRFKEHMYSYLEESYFREDVRYLALTDVENLRSTSLWQMEWFQMSPKTQERRVNSANKRWDVLKFKITYDKLEKKDEYERFFKCVKACITMLHPFYAHMDDIGISVLMSEVTGINRVLPVEYGIVRKIHWGNYWGEEYCKKYDLLSKSLPVASFQEINRGILFTLTGSALDYASEECFKLRKQVARTLGIRPPNRLFR